MANYALMYKMDALPEKDKPLPNIEGLAETKWDESIICRLMVSDSPRLVDSLVYKNAKAIIGNYSPLVLDRLTQLLNGINEIQKNLGENVSDFSGIIKWFTDNQKDSSYILYEPAEVFAMTCKTYEEIDSSVAAEVDDLMKMDATIAGLLKAAADSSRRFVLDTLIDEITRTELDSILSFRFPKNNDGSKLSSLFPIRESNTIEVNGNVYMYDYEKGHIVVYDSTGQLIGRYDSPDDFRHDINTNPDTVSESVTNSIEKEITTMTENFKLDGFMSDIAATKKPAEQGPVGGGIPEKPTAKSPEVGPTPDGGLKERPTPDKPCVGPMPPKSEEIDQETYNNALDLLKKSFKEAAGIMDYLQSVSVVSESPEAEKDDTIELVESAMDTAFETLSAGPLFERVRRDDKEKVKAIIADIRDDVFEMVKADKLGKMYKPVRLMRRLVDNSPNGGSMSAWWGTFAWQVIGAAVINEDTSREFEKILNEKYKDKLDGYKILVYRSTGSICDIFRRAWGMKNMDHVYLVFIDKSIPKELKEADEAASSDGEAESVKKESADSHITEEQLLEATAYNKKAAEIRDKWEKNRDEATKLIALQQDTPSKKVAEKLQEKIDAKREEADKMAQLYSTITGKNIINSKTSTEIGKTWDKDDFLDSHNDIKHDGRKAKHNAKLALSIQDPEPEREPGAYAKLVKKESFSIDEVLESFNAGHISEDAMCEYLDSIE